MKRSNIDAMICRQEKITDITRETINKIQLDKLNAVLKREKERQGFYRDLPERLESLDDLKTLPFTTESDLAQKGGRMLLCSQGEIQRIISEQTSGTAYCCFRQADDAGRGPSVLEEARKRHGNPKLRSSDIEMKDLFVAVKDYYLEPEPTKNLMDFCMNHQLSMTNLLLLGIRTYLSKVNNGQEDITIQNFISRRSTHDEWTSGGSRTIMFPCRTVIAPETDFLSAAYEIQNMQNRIYMHSNYDPALIMDEMRKRYNTPEHTGYESCYLTYQPMTVKVENEMLGTIRQHAKWFANGAATKKMYLTVSHTEDGGMNFSYHYQTAHLEEHDMELLYYYMMRILFKGIAEPDMSIGEIMELV